MSEPRMPSEVPEIDLIAQAQRGNREAYGELVYRHRKGVLNLVCHICGDEDLAEDLAQEVFVRAWEKLPDYQPRSPFRNWVYRMATNATLDVLRRQVASVDVAEVRLASAEKPLEKIVEEKERSELIRAALQGLPPKSRSVLVLREYDGFSYREIADALEIPIGTVMSRLSNARKALRKSVKKLLETL